jgi:hypothetical protein
MDAVQRMRQKARDFGYLRTNPQIIVSRPFYDSPTRPDFYVVPYYDPAVMFILLLRALVFAVAGAINFRFGISVGAAFRPWDWGGQPRIDRALPQGTRSDAYWGRLNPCFYLSSALTTACASACFRLACWINAESFWLIPRAVSDQPSARRDM